MTIFKPRPPYTTADIDLLITDRAELLKQRDKAEQAARLYTNSVQGTYKVEIDSISNVIKSIDRHIEHILMKLGKS